MPWRFFLSLSPLSLRLSQDAEWRRSLRVGVAVGVLSLSVLWFWGRSAWCVVSVVAAAAVAVGVACGCHFSNLTFGWSYKHRLARHDNKRKEISKEMKY
ncbi:hypothetical protein E2C01_087002 [Portunus trituberculatus]|uniref:Uncharacterized protein n=1 Tax=Portunus trituberculatus TaxID=210409 RepID=A0A5B7JCW6_PORTR|nr:hypothetical protein [Portunus trituberculatus]